MSDKTREKPGVSSRIVPIALFVLAGVLVLSSVLGYVLQGTRESVASLDQMRTNAVLHAASEGLINNIAQQARADKLAELRKDKNFRKRGLDEVNAICDAARDEARAEAEKLYANPEVADRAALENAISVFEGELTDYSALSDKERAAYAEMYVQLVDNTVSWTAIASGDKTDGEVVSALSKTVPSLAEDRNAHLVPGFVRLARDMAAKQQAKEDAETQTQLLTLMAGAVADWTEYIGLDKDALWQRLTEDAPELAGADRFRDALIQDAQARIDAAEKGETLPAPAAQEAGADTVSETQADYAYFAPTETLSREEAEKNGAYEELYAQLVAVIPDLKELPSKLQGTLARCVKTSKSCCGWRTTASPPATIPIWPRMPAAC